MKLATRFAAPLALAAAFLCATPAAAQMVAGTVVLRGGDMPMGAAGAVTALRAPFVNGINQVGFVGVAGGEQFVWVNNAVAFTASDEMNATLTTNDTDGFGLSDAGGWVFGPGVNGAEAAYGDMGTLFVEDDAVPPITNGQVNYVYSPRMTPNGDVYVVMSVDTNTDNITDERALLLVPGGNLTNATVVLKDTDQVSMEDINGPFGVLTDIWDVSNNGMHYGIHVDLVGTQADNEAVVVDGALALREGDTTGGNDNFQNFNIVQINDNGDYVISGDTSATGNDRYLSFNGTLVLQEGDTFNGITYGGGQQGLIDGLEINNNGNVAFVWGNAGTETLFLTCDNTDFENTTTVLAAVGDGVDIDNDQVDDYTLTNFNASTQNPSSVALTNDGFVYVNVGLNDGNGNAAAILQLEAACCGDMVVGGSEECDDGMESSTCNADCTMAVCGDDKINATAGEECEIGTGGETQVCDDDCTFPMCGDGNHNATAGEDCDDGGESATCDSDCTPAECGDGLLNAAAGEQCEDGNTADGDGCSATCQNEGTSGSGGSGSGTGGGSGTGTGTGGAANQPGGTEEDSGCGCTTPGNRNNNAPLGLAALSLLGLALLRRRQD